MTQYADPPNGDRSSAACGDGVGLCLSGGGYRAMLFHAGVIWRLNELGYLPRLTRISSVSGGSIAAAVLAVNWGALAFNKDGVGTQYVPLVVDELRLLASRTIDRSAVLRGTVTVGRAGNRLAALYRKHLFADKTLQDLPDDPRFVINATNIQSGVLWRFSKPYMRDYRVGEVKNPKVSLALAVAASSAFPPLLSPVRMKLDPSSFTPGSGLGLQREPFTRKVVLTDGGVYDNLGLEAVKQCGTVLVSDAGGTMAPDERPKWDWMRHLLRNLFIIDNQVRSLRKRQLVASFESRERRGTYWGIRTNIADYRLDDALDCPVKATRKLAAIPTRLKRLNSITQQRLINWGYAVCDAAMRCHVDENLPKPSNFPFESAGVG